MTSGEQQGHGFNINALLQAEAPLPNDDLALKGYIAEHGYLVRNTSVIAVRPATAGEPVETWIKGQNGQPVLERTATAKEGDVVAVGVLGEQYIPSKASIEKNREPVGTEGLREDEKAPPLPNDGHDYTLFRTNGQDYRLAAVNPFEDQDIYLCTSSGRLQTGIPGGLMAAQISPPSVETEDTDVVCRLDVARFIGPEEFAASYTAAGPEDYTRFGVSEPASS